MRGETFARRLADRADTDAGTVAFRVVQRPGGSAEDLTWGDLWARAAATAGRLDDATTLDSRIGIACVNALDYVVALAACFISRHVAVPLPTALSRRSSPRAQAVLTALDPPAILVSGKAPDWIDHDRNRGVVPVAEETSGPVVRADPGPGDDALALIQFSSGSTGLPKGVALSHANVIANCNAIAGAYGLDRTTRGFSWLPLHHDMGLIGHVVVPLWIGCRSTLWNPLRFLQRPLAWLQLVGQERATITSAPNFAYELAARAAEGADLAGLDLSSLTTAVCGGERVVDATVERFLQTFAVAGLAPGALAPSYGLAEATLLAASGKTSAGPRFVAGPGGTATADLGPSVDSVHLAVVDAAAPDTDGRAVGEIEISGPSVGRIIGPDGQLLPAGPVRTGDRGYLEGGRLRITGRLKDIIIVRGQNVAAGDVEAAAVAANDDVQPGGVCALADVGAATEELLVVVEVAARASRGPVELAASVSAAVSGATGVVPGRVLVAQLGALPRTPSGKVQRHMVRGLLLAGRLNLV